MGELTPEKESRPAGTVEGPSGAPTAGDAVGQDMSPRPFRMMMIPVGKP